jgi:hypothetical protein
MAILTYACMQIDLFAEIVRTTTYEVETELSFYEWTNTNRLLGADID